MRILPLRFAFLLLVPVAAAARPLESPADTPAVAAPSTTPADATKAKEPMVPGDARYWAKIHELEERVISIKERIYNAKMKLSGMTYNHNPVDNIVPESRAKLVQRNNLGAFFQIQSVVYFLDGKKIFALDNAGGQLNTRRAIDLFDSSVQPGNHQVSVEIGVRGDAGVFSYVGGYEWKLRSTYTFFAQRGRITEVGVEAAEFGGIGTALEDRPTVLYRVTQVQNRRD